MSTGILAQPLIDHAGQDITHWFDSKTKNVIGTKIYAGKVQTNDDVVLLAGANFH